MVELYKVRGFQEVKVARFLLKNGYALWKVKVGWWKWFNACQLIIPAVMKFPKSSSNVEVELFHYEPGNDNFSVRWREKCCLENLEN